MCFTRTIIFETLFTLQYGQICIFLMSFQVSFTLQVDLSSFPDDLIRQVLTKRAVTTGTTPASSEQYVLKVWGRDEYMLGDFCLSQFMVST